MENTADDIRRDIRAIVTQYDGKVNFEEWDKPEEKGFVTMMRAIMTFKIHQ